MTTRRWYCNGSKQARHIDDRLVGSVVVDVDVAEWSTELDRLHARFAHRFARSEPRRRAWQYLYGCHDHQMEEAYRPQALRVMAEYMSDDPVWDSDLDHMGSVVLQDLGVSRQLAGA